MQDADADTWIKVGQCPAEYTVYWNSVLEQYTHCMAGLLLAHSRH